MRRKSCALSVFVAIRVDPPPFVAAETIAGQNWAKLMLHFFFSFSCLFLSRSAVIFEFRHYKREKKKISVKCWGFIDREVSSYVSLALFPLMTSPDAANAKPCTLNTKPSTQDIKDGRHVLELYKKPTDMRRKNLSLMSIKPLYLHVDMEVQGSGPKDGRRA